MCDGQQCTTESCLPTRAAPLHLQAEVKLWGRRLLVGMWAMYMATVSEGRFRLRCVRYVCMGAWMLFSHSIVLRSKTAHCQNKSNVLPGSDSKLHGLGS